MMDRPVHEKRSAATARLEIFYRRHCAVFVEQDMCTCERKRERDSFKSCCERVRNGDSKRGDKEDGENGLMWSVDCCFFFFFFSV